MGRLEDTNQLQKIKLWAKIQIIIAVVAAIFTIIILTQISPLIQEKKQLEKEIAQLAQQKADLQKSMNQAVDILNKKESIILSDKRQYDDTKLKNLITPRTSADLLNKGSKGTKYYLFKLWIEAPEEVKRQINRVEYFFNHPTFMEKRRSSQNADENFSIQYKGWGCLSLVVITVFPQNGNNFDIYFDMCANL